MCSNISSCQTTGIDPLEHPFQDHADEAAIYLFELTADQVAEVYNEGSPPDLDGLASATLPTGWWRMNECTDQAITLVCDEGTGKVTNSVPTFFPGTLLNGAAFSTEVP